MKNIAQEVFNIEISELEKVKNKLDENFEKAVELVLNSKGRFVITGMGKSGHIGVKISATLASVGTPSFFMHPAEAIHGDLGMLTKDDVVLAISNSGESEEIVKLIPHLKRMEIKFIGMAGNPNSTLAKESDVFLDIGVEKEACPLQLAPTSSTTATLVMGDALAVALMKKKNFKPENFASFHPGGSLGRKLLRKVKDLMRRDNLPIVNRESSFEEIINTITSGRLGLVIVMDNDKLIGIITDGDLRRGLQNNTKSRFDFKAEEIMTKNPKIISPEEKVVKAEEFMIKNKINSLLVMENGKLLGVFELYEIGNV
jgi:arabinose-5-phosphate isomerase